MDKDAVPSKAMVSKLLKHNGYGPRLENYVLDYPLYIALPYLDREFGKEIVRKFLQPEDLEKEYQKVYAQHLTGDEILSLIAFYKSPLGQKLVQHDEEIRKQLEKVAMDAAVGIAVELVKEAQRLKREEDGFQNGLETS